MGLETQIFNAIHDLAGQSKLLDWAMVFLASYLGYFLILGVIYILFKEKDWKKSFLNFSFLSIAVILSRGLLTEIIRFFYFRPRPFVALEFEPLFNHSALQAAFPSGHASFYFALAFALFFLGRRRLGLWYAVGAVFMGLARVYAGVHWPLDIVAGALVGLLAAFVVKSLLSHIKR